jgi:TonB family protein
MEPPVLTHKVDPALPEQEKRRYRMQPFMLFQLTIDTNGNVTDVQLLKANDRSLVPYIVPAMKQWKYRPAKLHGEPVAVLYDLTFTYEVR